VTEVGDGAGTTVVAAEATIVGRAAWAVEAGAAGAVGVSAACVSGLAGETALTAWTTTGAEEAAVGVTGATGATVADGATAFTAVGTGVGESVEFGRRQCGECNRCGGNNGVVEHSLRADGVSVGLCPLLCVDVWLPCRLCRLSVLLSAAVFTCIVDASLAFGAWAALIGAAATFAVNRIRTENQR
jgi:hypothetical protein